MEGDIKINDIVLLCIDNTPRLHWVFSRVLEIHKSKSGWVRSVRLKLPTTTLVLQVNKICLLEEGNENVRVSFHRG